MADMVYVKIYLDAADTVELLSDTEAGRLLKALLAYAGDREIPALPGQEKLVYSMLRAQIDRDREDYAARCRMNTANGAKGGRPRKNQTVSGKTEENQTVILETEKTQDKNKNKNKTIEEDKNNLPSPSGSVVNARTRAKLPLPPEEGECVAYVREKGLKVDPHKFFYYYERLGWRINGNPVEDWRAALEFWALTEQDRRVSPAGEPEDPNDCRSYDIDKAIQDAKTGVPAGVKKKRR